MNYDNIYFIELIKSAIFDTTPKEPTDDLDWNYIFNKSEEQNITGLIYCAVNKLKNTPEQEIVSKFNNNMLYTIAICAKQYNEFLRINKIIKDEGLTFIGLKGCIIRNLYPVPELRTMGDFDILVNKAQLKRIKEIFAENNYNIENDAYGIVCNKGIVHWELFYTIEEEFNINTEKWDRLYYKEIVEKNFVSCPNPTYFLMHLLVHTGKHLLGTGAGIRNLCDIALFIKEYDEYIDYNVVENGCKEQGYYNVYCYIISSLIKYFDITISADNVPLKDCDKFLSYMLLNGIFGKHDNTLLMQLTKKQNQDDSFIKKLFFPPIEALEYRYKYLKKHRILLPFAWIHRFFSAVFRLKISVKQMVMDTPKAAKYAESRKKWIDELELLDK